MKSNYLVKSCRFYRLKPLTALILAAVMFSGCTTTDFDRQNAPFPPQKTHFRLEPVPSEGVFVSEVKAARDGDGMVIYGKVKRTAKYCCDAARGHVDIEVVGPDGEIVDLVSVSYSPRNIPKGITRSSHFSARLPYLVPRDFPLRISYQSDDEHAFSGTDMTDNLAWMQNQAVSDSKS